jgi:SAM-dependent methyltransferase
MLRSKDTTAKRQEAFFEADGQELYDSVINGLVPLHPEMLRVFETVIKAHCKRCHAPNSPMAFLDIGSGTGTESLWAAREFPNVSVLAVDASARMNAIFKRKLAIIKGVDASLAGRIKILQEDFIAPRRGSLLAKQTEIFDVAFSIYVFHHFKHEEKVEGYRRAFSLLKPGGLFVIADLYGYQSPAFASLALDWDLNHIETCFDDLQAAEHRYENTLVLNDLRQKWLDHYRNDNITEPIEGEVGQLALLEKAGFKHAACLFRYWQVGLLVAVKPPSIIH